MVRNNKKTMKKKVGMAALTGVMAVSMAAPTVTYAMPDTGSVTTFAAEAKSGKLVIDAPQTKVDPGWGTPRFDIAFKPGAGQGTNTQAAIPRDEEAKFVEETNIEINGTDFNQ